MTTIGTIIRTHTGPARVVVMVPADARTNGESYLTQAVAGGSVPATVAPAVQASAGGQSGSSGNDSGTTTTASTQAAVQSVFVVDPHALSGNAQSSDGQGDPITQPDNASSADKSDGTSSATVTSDQKAAQKAEDNKQAHHWEPSGSAKIAALYRSTEQLNGGNDTTAKADHVTIYG